jgi:hypothetical protein
MKEPRMEPIPDIPSPGIHFEIDRLIKLIKEGKTADPFSETRGRTQDAAWVNEVSPGRIGLESQDAALWIATIFYKTGHKVRLAVGLDHVDVPHMSHIWVEVWNPDLEVWVPFDPNAVAFADHAWEATQFLEV